MTTQVVLVTGALAGIGRATALAFARQGAHLVISGRREEAGQQLLAEIRQIGAVAEFFRADVRIEDDVRRLLAATKERFGRLDVAVNNAGTEGELGPITGQSVENYRAVFDTNVLGSLLSMKYELPLMLAQGSGSIVNLSSMVGLVGGAGASVYAASKHAIEGLTQSAALEVAGSGVRINAVAPGPVDTEMFERFVGGSAQAKAGFLAQIPAKRAARVEEIAETILFLASDKVGYLTGQAIRVDGGYTAQ